MWDFNNYLKSSIGFAVVFCLCLGCSRRDDDHYNRLGVNYLNNSQHDYAIGALKKAIKLNPSNAEAHFNLGRAYKRSNMNERAKNEFLICTRINPEKFNEYEIKYREKIDFELTETQNYSELGRAYAEKGMFDNAINAYKKLLVIEPENAYAHYSLGILYSKKAMFDDAADELWMAIEIDPNITEAHYNLGLIYYRQGLFDKAIKEYQMALKQLPETQKKKRFGVHYKLGLAYDSNKLFGDAIREFKKAIELMPDNSEVHNQLSIAYKKAGLFEKSEKEAKIYEKLKKF
jgi:superkiller protein 3